MNNKWKYTCEKAATELSGLKEGPFWLTKNTFSGKSLPEHYPQMQNQDKAVSIEASTDTPVWHRRTAARLQSITPAHFPASGTQRDIWHVHLPNRKQAEVAARCLRVTEPEVSKNLKQSNHHNNCWLMNIRTKQQTKKGFVTASEGSPRDVVNASHPARPWLCAEHQNSRLEPSDVLEKLMRVNEWNL